MIHQNYIFPCPCRCPENCYFAILPCFAFAKHSRFAPLGWCAEQVHCAGALRAVCCARHHLDLALQNTTQHRTEQNRTRHFGHSQHREVQAGAHHTSHIANNTSHTKHHTLHTKHHTLHITHNTLHTKHHTLFTKHHTLHTKHNTLHIKDHRSHTTNNTSNT